MFSFSNNPFTNFITGLSQQASAIQQLIAGGDVNPSTVASVVSKTGIQDVSTATTLLSDYSKHVAASKKGATLHDLHLSDDELNAQALFKRRGSLTATEEKTYKELLQKLYAEEQKEQEAMYRGAEELLEQVRPLVQSGNLDRATLEERVIDEFLKKTSKEESQLAISDYSLIEMVTSRLLLEQLDRNKTGDTKETVSYLAAAYKEHNRIEKKSEIYSGEDFLAVKARQLDFLYKGLKHYDWQLCFVDDEPNTGQKRTLDVIESKKQNDDRIKPFTDKIIVLDYDRDLKEERAAYKDADVQGMSSNDFAKKSVKGGAIETGLRYLARTTDGKAYKTKPSDIIIYTDCDTSINLAGTGVLVNMIESGSDVAIGSRRIQGAHVIGKSAERHMQSFMFNLLVRALLNLQVTDTQVGAKAFRPNVIKKTHEGYSELSMAFDPQVLRLAAEAGFKIDEQGMVWIDSEIESKSADQSQNMFQGLLRLAQTYYPMTSYQHESVTALQSPQVRFMTLAQAMIDEKGFDKVLNLALDPKWHLITKFSGDIYNLISPKEWRNFINSAKTLLQKIANNEAKDEDIMAFIGTVQDLVNNARESALFSFFMKEFPQIFDVVDLLHRNKDYVYVLAPMLFGDTVYTKLLSKLGYVDLTEFKEKSTGASGETPENLYRRWIQSGNKLPKPEQEQPKRSALKPNEERIGQGVEALKHVDKPITVGLVLQYNMDATSKGFIDSVLIGKIKQMQETFGDNPNVTWKIYVVDAREEGKNVSGIDKYIDEKIKEASNGRVQAVQIRGDGVDGKAKAVRFGMDKAAADGCDVVGFMDLSDKIDVREMGNLVNKAVTQMKDEKNEGHACVIGSRRHEDAEVENKPLTFLMRSMGLNLLVKGLFPRLFSLSDTQTGFKVMSAKTWKEAKAQGLKINSLAFDIELLQQVSRVGSPIEEHPVDFYDNSMKFDQDFGEDQAGDMFGELIQIRAAINDNSAKPVGPNEAVLFGGGAENAVYKMADGTLLKIPHEAVDPHFLGVLKYFLLKNQKEMGVTDQKDKLVTTGFINQILSHPRFSQYIPALRSWSDFNLLVMKVITSIENKNYKSVGYETAERLGKDLVIPFRFVREPFAIKIDGVEHQFNAADDVKQTVMANEVFKNRFTKILTGSSADSKVANLKAQIDQGIELFEKLWQRGLFDIDANFMCDTGYFTNSRGQEVLMSLDPGELIDDCTKLNVEIARAQILKRYDYIEMEILLRKLPDAQKNEVLKYYEKRMNEFFDRIDADVKLDEQQRDFGREQRENVSESFAVVYDKPSTLESVTIIGTTASQEQRQAMKYSAVGYQLPYSGLAEWPMVHDYQEAVPFYHIVPENYHSEHAYVTHEKVEPVRVGSIKPALEILDKHGELTTDKKHEECSIVLLDAGTASRSALLKYAQPECTKGNIQFDHQRLYQYAVAPMQSLAKQYLSGDYVIITSSDDILYSNEAKMQEIQKYFSGDKAPGAYWFDFAGGGRDIAPMTVEDTKTYMQSERIHDMAEAISRNTPISAGMQKSGVIQQGFGVFHRFLHLENTNTSSSSSSTSPAGMAIPPGLGQLAGFYTQFLQYQALMQAGGMKKPFTMIFKREFLADFYKLVNELLPDFTLADITWENILIRGMKSDLTIWKIAGKPAGLDNQRWEQLWRGIQQLKTQYNINTEDPVQNQSREINFEWANFDDPYALFRFTQSRAEQYPDLIKKFDITTVYSDSPLVGEINVISAAHGALSCVNCDIQGTINIQPLEGIAGQKKIKHHETMLYNVNLPVGAELYPVPNHVVSQIGGKIYSVSMAPQTKEQLKDQMVYVYGEDGKPAPYKKFAEFSKELASKNKQTLNI